MIIPIQIKQIYICVLVIYIRVKSLIVLPLEGNHSQPIDNIGHHNIQKTERKDTHPDWQISTSNHLEFILLLILAISVIYKGGCTSYDSTPVSVHLCH